MTSVQTLRSAGTPVECDSCGRPAKVILRWPDAAFRVCELCLSDGLRPVAEPLDPDDDLASDPLNAAERARERGSLT